MYHPDLLAIEVHDRQVRYQHQAYQARLDLRHARGWTHRLRTALGR